MTQEGIFDRAIYDDYDNDDIDLRQYPYNAWLPHDYANHPSIFLKHAPVQLCDPQTREDAYREQVDEEIFKFIIELQPRIIQQLRSKARIVIADLRDCMIFKYLRASSLTDTFFLGLVQCVDGYDYKDKRFYVGFPAYNALKANNCVGIATFPAHPGDAIIGAIGNVIQVLSDALGSTVDLIVVKTSEVPGLPSRIKQINPMELQRHGRLDNLAQYLLEQNDDM